jgi:arginine decarboxylase
MTFDIKIVKGVGSGKTSLSAFDNALWNAGIANYNLIYLSSIIPPKSQIEFIENLGENNINIGHKLYVVMSRCDEVNIGKEAWAGLGWIQKGDGSGIFAEHCADNEEELNRLLNKSLKDMISYRNGLWRKTKIVTCGIRCVDKPVCAVVAAVYKSEKWK